MGIITSKGLPDMQKSTEGFAAKSIDKVGVRNMRALLPFLLKNGSTVPVEATMSCYCSLPATSKGVNMSRNLQSIEQVTSSYIADLFSNKTKSLQNQQDVFFPSIMNQIVKELIEKHNTPYVYAKARFDLLLSKQTPMTSLYSAKPVKVEWETVSKINDLKETEIHHYLTVTSKEASLCPCSKSMSLLINNISADEKKALEVLPKSLYDKVIQAGFGAHNQRSEISATVELTRWDATLRSGPVLWVEDLVDLITKSASTETFSLLKRPDEKWVTETAYLGGYYDDDHNFNKVEGAGPKFCEDIARDVAVQLDNLLDDEIKDYVVVVNNDESIHSENIMATAILSAGRQLH